MVDRTLSPSSLHDFSTWEPVLRLLRDGSTREATASSPLRVTGRIGLHGWSLPLRRRALPSGRTAPAADTRAETEAVERVRDALADAGLDDISFTTKITPTGEAAIRLLARSPAVESGLGPHPGALLLVEGAVPQPWRCLPEPVPGAVAAASADPALLERTLRERLPDAIGASETEMAAAEARLGVALPEELKALYRVTRSLWEDWGDDHEAPARECAAVGCELFPLDGLYIADASSRHCSWTFAAKEAVVTPPDAAVQGLVGSPGWIVFGDNGGGDRLAVDLTPAPRGHIGQIIMIGHEENIGAALVADSLTDLVTGRLGDPRGGAREDRPPAVAHVNVRSLPSIEAAAHPGLEVLSIGVWDAEPLSLAPVVGLPRLRTLAAYPGTLTDPLEIAGLTALEYLEVGPEEWRVLLDAGAVPRGLSAAAVKVHGDEDVVPVGAVVNELLALWGRPQIIRTLLRGDLGPVP
ncbi:SMI1/KNR4 family protein [Streptomyces pactum]|uniref:Cell wall assembly regulator n=1 Tax=Streptomyces pactum TaxID=68249 RepID=A0A1S6JI61_9ACTN|nr:SMI1/KNR4 family protein [Streptomyces pactum]AQS71445.1 cell wall assembly regulator [Streptomyces pactum]